MKILPVIFYLLKVISIISIGVFAVFFFGTIISYLLDKHEERYIKMPVSQIMTYISLAPEKYEICEGKVVREIYEGIVLRGSLVLFPNSFIGYIKMLLFEHKLEKKKANTLNKKEYERYLKIVLDDVENLKKQNTEIVQRICKPPVDPIAAYFDNKNS